MPTSTHSRSDLDLGEGFDFTDPEVLSRGMPLEQFARVRKTAPVWWVDQDPNNGGGFRDGGYWVISKHAHIREISRDPDIWSSNLNGCVMRYSNTTPPEQLEAAKILMHNSDAPQHTRLRKLISRLFTPRSIAQLEEGLAAEAREIVTAAAEKTEGDFVEDVAAKLPLKAIADLVGFPKADYGRLFDWTNIIMAAEDPDNVDDPLQAMVEFMGYTYELAAERKSKPGDDIISRLVNADSDGDQLSEIEFGYFMLLLLIAGNETTRNATSAGMFAMLTNPEQWQLFTATRPPTTVDEIVRFTSPVNSFQRTARQDTEIGGVTVRRGERVGLFYSSGNYDEDVFADPFRLDITRSPNPHLGFGGNGPHFCIGANLARRELALIFDAIAEVLPGLELTGPITRMKHGWINGITSMPVRFNARQHY